MKLTGMDRQTDRRKDQADVLTKRGALGNLGYVRLAILTLMAGIKIFGPQIKSIRPS